jgi:hypothetical protein
MLPTQVEPLELLVEELDELLLVELVLVEPLLDELLLVIEPLLVELLLIEPLLLVPEPPAPPVPPLSPECPLEQAASMGAATAKTSVIPRAFRPRLMAITFSISVWMLTVCGC